VTGLGRAGRDCDHGPGARDCAALGPPDRRRYRRLVLWAIGITALVLVAEIVGGFAANSLALLSDAGHVLTDLLALVLSYTAFVISDRPANHRKSFGYYRIEILAALFNGALLVVIAVVVLRESFLRMMRPEPVVILPLLLAAVAGLAGNLASMFVLSRARSNLNMRGAFLHVLGDTLSSVGVVAAGLVVAATGWQRVDAIVGALIGLVIIWGAVRLLKESVDILLEACPVEIDGGLVARRILSLPEIHQVHDLHIWSITSGMHALSGHVVLKAGHQSSDDLLGRLQALLRDEFQVAHTTFQVESQAFEDVGHVH